MRERDQRSLEHGDGVGLSSSRYSYWFSGGVSSSSGAEGFVLPPPPVLSGGSIGPVPGGLVSNSKPEPSEVEEISVVEI